MDKVELSIGLRLERAAMRLKSSLQPVTVIALEAGYETHEAFTRAFHGHFGSSPSDDRKQARAVLFPAVDSGVHLVAPGARPDYHPACRGGGAMEVKIETSPARRVAFLRHVGPYSQVGEAWGKLYAWAGKRGYFPPFAKFLAIVHDDPEVTPAERLRYDAGFVVKDGFQPQAEIGVQEPAGECMPWRCTWGRMSNWARPTPISAGSGRRAMAGSCAPRLPARRISTPRAARSRRRCGPKFSYRWKRMAEDRKASCGAAVAPILA